MLKGLAGTLLLCVVWATAAEDIRRFGYRTLEEVLQSMAGVYTSYDRNYAQAGIRGFSRPTDFNNRILLLIDGHTTNESNGRRSGHG